ncbi:unnamed protein product [Peronospora belbahrii]|uniref:Transposase n=1 Tax=Peronospora belbahrii TaxID=622444 RepID=A0AAU9LL70_9STRA|nr:unnamed protein product [Peronospora belbahrii]CAH0513873.1 unnamed protein product [Peronospora belbahrii]
MSTKGKWLTIEQKCQIIAQHHREPSINYTQLSLWAKTRFELSPNHSQYYPGGSRADTEHVHVDKLRQKATERLRELEKEARELRKYLRRLNATTNAHL